MTRNASSLAKLCLNQFAGYSYSQNIGRERSRYLYPASIVLSFLFVLAVAACQSSAITEPGAESGERGSTEIPAFPGAQGYGAVTHGGRGGKICEVTTLEDDKQDPPPGSLRHCVSKVTGPRTVIFRVAGVIHADQIGRFATEENDHVTIAGQTAPGSGITIDGSLGPPSDAIVRFIRITGSTNNIGIPDGERIILDHISARFATNDNVEAFVDTLTRPGASVRNLTLSRSIVGPGDDSDRHATGGGWRGGTEGGQSSYELVADVDYHHNLWTDQSHRNPRTIAVGAKLINNVVYNVKHEAFESHGAPEIDYINNYIKNGPMRNNALDIYVVHSPRDRPGGDRIFPSASLYLQGNIGQPDFPGPLEDQWLMVYNNWTNEPLDRKHQRLDPLPAARFPINIQTAEEAFESVLADVGANRRLNCRGEWVEMQDVIDRKLVRDARNGTGPSQLVTPATFGVTATVDPGAPCSDSDHDGMPDEYENLHSLNPDDPLDRNTDLDGDGFTNLQEYLSGSQP